MQLARFIISLCALVALVSTNTIAPRTLDLTEIGLKTDYPDDSNPESSTTTAQIPAEVDSSNSSQSEPSTLYTTEPTKNLNKTTTETQTTEPSTETSNETVGTSSTPISTTTTKSPQRSESVDLRKTFLNFLENPLVPASFMKISRTSLLCKDKGIMPSKLEMDISGVIVEEVRDPEIENKIREITNRFIETLKYDRSWFVSLLFHIRKEQKRRESIKCQEAECIYKIPCYLSQRFLALSMYDEVFKHERVREGFDLLRRRRRSLDGMDISKRYTSAVEEDKAPVTNCTGVYANYCYNSIACIYVSVLESAACS